MSGVTSFTRLGSVVTMFTGISRVVTTCTFKRIGYVITEIDRVVATFREIECASFTGIERVITTLHK